MALTKAQLIDLNGNELILDLDADTSITADTDDQIDIKIGGADDFRFTANTFTALSGSTIAAQALTATTLTTTGAIAIANDGNIGSAGDADAIAISSSGVVTFSQSPVFPDGSLAVVDLDIDGATDIGANLADADLFVVDDGAGGTNRKMAASRIATYVGASAGAFSIANLDIDGGTDIGAALVDADEIIVDDGGGGTNRRSDMSRVKTYIADVTLTTAAQTNITSLGTLSALTVDDVAIDGKVITMTGSTDDTFVTTVAANGATSLVTTDTAAAAANLTITADGTVGINSTGDMTLDSSTDIIFDADGGDFSFKDGGTEILKISNSSSDVIIKPIVDTKDLIFQQRDGTEVARIEDNATFNVVTGKLAINGTAITSTAAELNFIDGGATIGTTAIADGDGIIHNDGGTMKVTSAATFKTYFQTGISSASDDLTAGDAAVNITTSSGNITIDAAASDSDIIFKGTDDSSDITMLTLDGSAAGEAIFNAGIVIADAGNIGSASDKDAIAIASNGVTTFSQAPVLSGASITAGTTPLTALDIDGATDIGAAIVDADLFVIDDGAGGTNRKVTASRIKTYAGFTATTITGTTALAVQPAADDEIIISDAGTLKRLDIKHIQATPAFAAQTSSSTSTAHNTYTKVQCDSEILDSDGTYDNSTNYRFTPGVAGKYFIFGMVAQGSGTGVNNMERQYTAIYKNGSKVVQTAHDGRNNAFGDTFSGTCAIILDLDGDDYVELYTKPLDGGSANCNYYTDSTCFGGYRIAGV